MNKKGFTLIELLAVIVILAIIALITAPIILGVIENARKDSAKDKAWGTINAVELAYTQDQIKDSSYKIGDPVTFSDKKASVGTTEVKASGELPESGTVTIRNDGSIIAQNLKFKDYTCSTVKSETDNTIDPNNMVCVKDDTVTPGPEAFTGTTYNRNVLSGTDVAEANYIKPGDSAEKIKGNSEDYNSLGGINFLKHIVKNGKVESSEVCFIKGGIQCLKGDDGGTAYETNKTLLLSVFGESSCNDFGGGINCQDSSLSVSAYNYGYVFADTSQESCKVLSLGAFCRKQ